MKLQVLPFHKRDLEDREMRAGARFDVGPLEFLRLFRGASAVFTDSFHGTLFSVIFRRPFLSFRRYDNVVEAASFSRIEGFLSRVGLVGQVASDIDVPGLEDLDFDLAHKEVDAWRKQSLSFLQSALAEATNT